VTPDVSPLLERLRAGDDSALNELVSALYNELHRIAARQLRGERPAHTLQTTALVHEAYMKLVSERQRGFADRAHFLAVASRIMRQVLVDYARARATRKRSGNAQTGVEPAHGTEIEVAVNADIDHVNLLALDAALDALARENNSLARLIEMRYFGGMTAEETAQVINQSVHVVRHDLRLAQAWLRGKLGL
jgi:RNA polymerase sigma factor (TIGR02999 family)